MLEIAILVSATLIAVALMWPRCLLTPCNWRHKFNTRGYGDVMFGVFQCARCKTISMGAEILQPTGGRTP